MCIDRKYASLVREKNHSLNFRLTHEERDRVYEYINISGKNSKWAISEGS